MIDPNELTWQLLGAYEVSPSYEKWCELVGLETDEIAADQSFALVHAAYADLWNAMGDAFFTRLAWFADHWTGHARGSGWTGAERPFVARPKEDTHE